MKKTFPPAIVYLAFLIFLADQVSGQKTELKQSSAYLSQIEESALPVSSEDKETDEQFLQVKDPSAVTWLPAVQTTLSGSDLITAPVDVFLKELAGSFRPIVCFYNESKLLASLPFKSGEVKSNSGTWSCKVQTTKISDKDGKVLDIKLVFKLTEGVAQSSGVAAAFDFNNWRSDNYVMIPASVYNGNRNKIEKRGYCTGFDKEDFYNKDIPQITTELPQLSPEPGLTSKIEVSTCNATTPSICFFDRQNKRGFIILAEQGIRKNGLILDNGLIVEENKDRSQATLVISAPGVRERKPEFIGFGASPDRGIDWKANDEVVMHLRVYSFGTPDIPGLLEKFMTVRI
jgi:hypothetical protein